MAVSYTKLPTLKLAGRECGDFCFSIEQREPIQKNRLCARVGQRFINAR